MEQIPALAGERRDDHQSSEVMPDRQKIQPLAQRVYTNVGNPLVINQIDASCRRVLDIGCGAGDNAALLRQKLPNCEVFGITRSEAEAERARAYMTECWVDDIEGGVPAYLQREKFDCLLFSHVLEHLRNPAHVVACMSQLLRPGGRVVIAVPNIMFFKMRLRFLRGDFEYDPGGGILDDTHLHFYTYHTADRYLLSESPDLRLVTKVSDGWVPFSGVYRRLMGQRLGRAIDRWGVRHWPNLFGYQIVLVAEKS
jgi:2-polyprenyl-3-methyl-5-hydroxy-6-metoxy-1,4-benzoquinol methylase